MFEGRLWFRRTVVVLALGATFGWCGVALGTVESGHISFGTIDPPSPELGNCQASIDQTLAGDDGTCATFVSTPTTLQLKNMCLDEGSAWYLASYGQEFSEATIADGRFPALIIFGAPVEVPAGNFYLGVRTYNGRQNDPHIFGWARLGHSGDNLVLLGSAMAFHEEGIYIGTTTAVPEPGSVVAGMATVILLGRRRGVKRGTGVERGGKRGQ
jgi:hypothetical protein